jgi:L-threonylcarbamoyladenylate synthase
VARIFAAKGRPGFNPLIVHVPDIDAAGASPILSPEAAALAEAFWPGALTLVLPLATAHRWRPLSRPACAASQSVSRPTR